MYQEKEGETGKLAERNNLEVPTATSTQRWDCNEKGGRVPEDFDQDHFHRIRAQRDETSTSASVADGKQNERPVSPGTLALLCDERDSLFLEEGLQSGMIDQTQSTRHDSTKMYAEQERIILTNFHDFLSKLISLTGVIAEGEFLTSISTEYASPYGFSSDPTM